MSGSVSSHQQYSRHPQQVRTKTDLDHQALLPSNPNTGNTELECGQLSSCSDSDESCSEETLDMVLNAGSGFGERPCSGEMNDVDEETMSGENDVSFSHLRYVFKSLSGKYKYTCCVSSDIDQAYNSQTELSTILQDLF